MTKEELNNLLEAVAGVLLRCWLMAFCLMFLSFFIYLAAGDWAYSMHARLYPIGRHSFDMMYYYGMGFMKIVIFLFFLFPYLSIKLILRQR